jgi:glycosyltransferase involved in cell wall biosynthesis
MPRRDLSHRDASTHAASELEYIIRKDSKLAQPSVPSVTAEQAMREQRVFEMSSNRNVTRVLFISGNSELLNPTQQTLDGYINISDLFDEVHILILREGIVPKNPVLRVAPNVWLYTASARHWWQTPKAGFEMAREQLVFASGFRADLIVARDPFESALVANKLAKLYNRPTQLHILEDYTTSDFAKQSKRNFWRLCLPRFTVPKFLSVRTLTSTMEAYIQKKFVIPDVATLPRYNNYEALIDLKTELVLKEKYQPLIFFILFVGKLNHASTLHRAMDAARFVLRNRRVGMIALGDGVARHEFEKRAKILEVEPQVIFEPKAVNVDAYLKSANILIVSDTDTDSEDVVLRGAAAGIPMVLARTDKREDLFVHGESAFLCEATDIQAFTDHINELLNNIGLRRQFAMNTQELIRNQFHSDPSEYLESYRTSIEQAFFVESGEEKTEEET